MRVNVDDKAHRDPKFARLGARCGTNRHEALGRCVLVWSFAYGNRSAMASVIDVDAVAELPGFAAAMVEVELATEAGAGLVRLRGVTERVEWLLEQDAKRALAADAKRRKREAQLAALADVPAGPSHGSVPAEGPNSPDPALALVLVPDGEASRPAGPSPGNGSKKEADEHARELASAAVEAINGHAGTRYEADSVETLKNARTLAKAKVTPEQIRDVVDAKWMEWGPRDEMRSNFKPSTLLRPKNFQRYLEDLAAGAPRRPPIVAGQAPGRPLPSVERPQSKLLGAP